jgi:ElaB/YqjD/DUF883 family membrane-anchored ribosome-binding protein
MDQERDQIREVEDARQRVASDVRSVAENANVVDRAKETVQSKVDDTKSKVSDRISDARDRLQSARDSMRESMSNMASNAGNMNPMENPLGMLLAGLAVGFLIGLALPVTRFESERIGPITDDMKDRMRQAGSEVMRRGTEVIKETIEGGREAATSSIQNQAREMGMGGAGSETNSGGSGGSYGSDQL